MRHLREEPATSPSPRSWARGAGLFVLCVFVAGAVRAEWPCDGDDSTWPERSFDPSAGVEARRIEDPTPASDAALTGDALLREINLELATLGPANPQRARKLLEDGLSDGRLESTPKILVLLGRAQRATGELERGIETLVAAARRTGCSRLFIEAAVLYDQQLPGGPRRAAKFLSSAIESGAFEPDDREWNLLVDMWDAGSDPRAAVSVLERSGLAERPAPPYRPHGFLYYRAAMYAQADGDAAEAVRLGVEAVERGQTDANVFRVLERAYSDLGDEEAARAARARAAQPPP